MADIAGDAGIKADEPFLLGASQLSMSLWDEAWSHDGQVLAGDAEALHDMRVALRRLRSCLENYQAPQARAWLSRAIVKEIKEHRHELGALGDAMGAVRDYDVLEEYLSDFGEREKLDIEASEELQRFRKYLQDARADEFKILARRVKKDGRAQKLRGEFRRWAASLAGVAGLSKDEISLQTAARIILQSRIEASLALGHTLEDGADEAGQHNLRKALRRTRYTLEAFAPAYDGKVKAAVKTLVELQDVLGEMQDRTVLNQTLQKAFKVKHEDDLSGDALRFAQFNVHKRRYLLGQVRALWQQSHNDKFWDTLHAMSDR